MEAFSLLKYWRGGGGSGGFVVGPGGGDGVGDSVVSSRATTIVSALAAQNAIETDDDDDEDGDDDGPFFDLEFAVPDDDEDEKATNGEENDDVESENDDEEEDDGGDGTDGEREFNFTLSSGSSNDRVDQNLPLSPSDDLFFKGRLVPIEPSSLVLNGSEPANSKPQFPVSFLKSATKFRVFMLGFKKSRMGSTEKEKNGEAGTTESKQNQQEEKKGGDGGGGGTKQSKLFTVKFKVEEVPIVSLFTRENSKNAKSSQKQNNNNTEEPAANVTAVTSATSDEKRFSKEVMQKYLKKVKPLYVRVSKRYGEKLRFSGQLSLGSGLKSSAPPQPPPPPSTVATAQKSSPSKQTAPAEKSQPEPEAVEVPPASNVKSLKAAGLRVVCKHLGKSRSASAAVAAAPSAPVTSRRRDDSLLQQQDGIQSAILHCKRSFNASRDSDSSLLSRSVSDPSYEKPLNSQANQQKGFQIS